MVKSENAGARLKKWFGRNFGHNAGDRSFHILNTVVFLLIGFVALYPFLYVVIKSLQAYDVSEGVQHVTYSFSAYKNIFSDDGILKTFLLSVAVVLAGTVCNVAVTYSCAYSLSKKYMRGRTALLIFVLIPMLFSGGLMPTYILIRQLNLKNNPLVYILPSLCSSFNVIIVKNFLHSVPDSMEEAAMLDGASHFKIMTKIYLPLSAPILATVSLWVAVGKWNDWMTGLLYVDEKSLYIMQNYLRTVLLSTYSAETSDPNILNKGESIVMASIVVGTLPVIVSFPFVQKYFIKGMILGSVKE